jgi:hypothetical protein
MDEQTLEKARQNLIQTGLIAWRSPLYQVLPLDPIIPPQTTPPVRVNVDRPLSLGEIFKKGRGVTQ